MPGPLDDTPQALDGMSPQDWVVRGGWSAAPAMLIDADIATVSGATDKVIRVTGSPNWLLAVDFQAGHDTRGQTRPTCCCIIARCSSGTVACAHLLAGAAHRGADSPAADRPLRARLPRRTVRRGLALPHRACLGSAVREVAGGRIGAVPLAPLGDVRGKASCRRSSPR